MMTWIWSSMTLKFSRKCMFLPTIRDIWGNLRQIYSIKQDIAICYKLKTKIFSTKQGTYQLLTTQWGMD